VDNNINYIPQIDYTSRDYLAIRDDLTNLINQFAPNWTSRDPSDLGMVMIELFSYLGDLMNFYTDRAANEGFIATASQRDSLLQLARMLGYVPTAISAASVTLTFNNSTASDVVVPAKTQVATTSVVNGLNTQIVFETNSAVTVPAKVGATSGTATVLASQGVTITDELLGTSTGAPSQVFRLSEPDVINTSVSVLINGISYSYSPSLLNNNSYDSVFSLNTDAEGYTYVVFGDGIGGRVPPTAASIYATYRVGNGTLGNVPAYTLDNMLTNITAGITVTNTEGAIGGADEESSDSIRLNAPRALKALTRAVSLKDYSYLALQVPGVAKANASSSVYTNVILYVAPFGDLGVVLFGGVYVPTATFNALAANVATYFLDKTPPNTTLTILPPTYVEIDIDMTVYVLPQYQQAATTTSALASIRELVSQDNSFFAEIIPVQYLLNAVSSVPGVDYATVELLRRTTSAQSFSVNNYSRSTNIVTITTTATHNVTVGQKIVVSDVSGAADGIWVVTAVTGTTISYATLTSGTINSTSVSPVGAVKAQVVETITCAVNEIPTEGTFNLTAIGGIQ
jgi:uncharacterized phage protein gp47/JayE